MMKRILLAATAVVFLASAASAQEAATIVLRSGERVSGQLIDHGGVGFTISVNGTNRNIPTGEVAVVEFAGSGSLTNDMLSRLNSGQHVIVLRNGQAISGNFYDIGGTTPLRITVDADGTRRDLTSSEVARIYLAPPPGTSSGTTGSTAGAAGSTTVTVPANQAWTPTGLVVRRGEVLNIRSAGELQLSGDANDKAHSAGAYSQRRPAAGAPLPQELAGALVARIGNGQPFAIGNNTTVTMPDAGQLFLGINDDSLGDNSGQYTVTIEQRTRRRR